MLVITKRQADKMIIESLFKPVNGRTLQHSKLPFCTGKYKASMLGKKVCDSPNVAAVYPVARKDKDGKYTQLRCVYLPSLSFLATG